MSGNHSKPEMGGVIACARPLLWGTAVSCAACALLLLLLAGVLSWRDVPPKLIDPLMIGASVVSAFAGGYVCARRMREKGMLMGILSGGVLFLLLFLCSLPVTGSAISTILPVKLFSLLLAGAVGGILGVNRRVRHH